MTYEKWAAEVITLFRMAGYDPHSAWTSRLPGMFDAGYTPSDTMRVIVQNVRVGTVTINIGQRGNVRASQGMGR